MSLLKSIATFGSFTVLSRITGFVRDIILAKYLGAGLVSDAFFVSFKLPNLFRSLFAEGAFNSAFVPIFSQKLSKDNPKDAENFAIATISLLSFVLLIFIILMEIFMPYVVIIQAPGFVADDGKIELATYLSRIMFPFLLLISIVSFQSGILNSLGKFAAPAAAPVILNVVMAISVFVLWPLGSSPAQSFAIGVTAAGFLEVIWLNYYIRKENIHLKPRFDIFTIARDKDTRTLFKRMAPSVLGSGIYQINVMVSTIIASLVGSGAISWLYYATRLQQLPLGVVGAAIGVAVLPLLSKQLKVKDFEEAEKTMSQAVEYGAILSIPAMFALIALAEPIINILFQYGEFGSFETQMTAKALIPFAIGMPPFIAVKALSQNFFARGDTKTPVKYAFISFVVNIVFALLLMGPFGHVGIAYASTLSAFVSFYQFERGLKKRKQWAFSAPLIKEILKITLASFLMTAAVTLTSAGFDLWLGGWLNLHVFVKIPILGFLCALGVATFVFTANILKVKSINHILSLTASIARKKNVKKPVS